MIEEEWVRPQHTHHQDYTFKQSAQVQHSQHGSYNSRYKMYDYPGRFKDWETAKQFTQYQQESHVRDEAVGYAQTDIIFPAAGHVFDLADHRNPAFNQRYLIISVHHQGRQPSVLEEEAGLVYVEDPSNDHGLITSYHNQMEFCIKERVFWRPKRRVRPVVDGPQIAKIVGPEGEEIYTDEYGRVKVQFPWDRYGQSNEHSSCWIRVSQNWAGMGWGHIAIPRIDQEVIVEFLEGDPDQPIVTGRTYHDVNRVPYNLADHKTRMTIKSKTHKGDGFNELRFEDEKGREEVFIHAEKDMNTEVENDTTIFTKRHKTETIGFSEIKVVGLNLYEQVTGSVIENIGYMPSWELLLNDKIFERHSLMNEHFLSFKNNTGYGNKVSRIKGGKSEFIGGSSSESIVGSKIITTEENINLSSMIHSKITASENLILTGNDNVVINNENGISLEMKEDGTLIIEAKKIILNGQEIISLKSAKINLN